VNFSVSTDRQADVAVVSPQGEIDLLTAQQLESEIFAALGSDAGALVVDLSGVTFMDSSGISALLRGRRGADAYGKPYRIRGAVGTVQQVLDLTGVSAHLSGNVS
jgi:anti-sigma B factor antagonist